MWPLSHLNFYQPFFKKKKNENFIELYRNNDEIPYTFSPSSSIKFKIVEDGENQNDGWELFIYFFLMNLESKFGRRSGELLGFFGSVC